MLKNISLVTPSWLFDIKKKLVHRSVCQYGIAVHTTPSQWETTAKHTEFTFFYTKSSQVTSICMTFALDEDHERQLQLHVSF